MSSGRKASLNAALAEIRQRWGTQALQKLGEEAGADHPCLPGGLPALDETLGTGLPRRRITEVCGTPTSGATTLALHLAALAQQAGLAVVWLDVRHLLPVAYAAHCGVAVSELLVVRPEPDADPLEIAGDLVLSGGADLVVAAAGPEPLEARPGAWQKLAVRVAKSNTALVVTSPVGDKPSSDQSHVSLRLRVERTRWLWEDEILAGWESRLTVVKNKLGPAGQSAPFAVAHPRRRP